jgi:TolA-binding protein
MMKTAIGSGRVLSALALMLLAPLAMTVSFGAIGAARAQTPGQTPGQTQAKAQAQTQAQTAPETTETRLRRIEAELRAVQRKVFPDGAGKTFGPEIAAPTNTAATAAPATSAVTDLLTRMDSVETQLQRLTAASEDNQNHLSKLEARMAALETSANTAGATAGTAATQAAAQSAPLVVASSAAVPRPAAKLPAKPADKPEPSRSDPPADRVAAVMAIEKLASDDKGEDEYTYGYRLWEAKFFPEAQQQLLRVVQQFPKHSRISYARNLLGRAYLDDGKPGTAAQYFLQNYQADRKGDRAADSLLYLGVAMSRLKEEKRACVAFAEFKQIYPAETIGRLKNQYEAAAKPVTCN